MAHSGERRKLVVEAHKGGRGTYKTIAEMFGVGEASVSRWLRRHRESGSFEPGHGGGNPPKIGEAGQTIVKAIVEEHPDRTHAEIAEEYQRRTGTKVSRSPIQRVLKVLGMTRKKKTLRASERQSPQVEFERNFFRRTAPRGSS